MKVIHPLREQILVKVIVKDKTAGGLVLPSSVQTTVKIAEVKAVGDGRYYAYGKEPLDVHPGDIVLYPDGAGFEFQFEGESFYMIPENSLLAIIKEEKPS